MSRAFKRKSPPGMTLLCFGPYLLHKVTQMWDCKEWTDCPGTPGGGRRGVGRQCTPTLLWLGLGCGKGPIFVPYENCWRNSIEALCENDDTDNRNCFRLALASVRLRDLLRTCTKSLKLKRHSVEFRWAASLEKCHVDRCRVCWSKMNAVSSERSSGVSREIIQFHLIGPKKID